MPNTLLSAEWIMRDQLRTLEETMKLAQAMNSDPGPAFIEYDATKGPPPERVVDKKTGISMRYVRDYDVQADQFPTRIYQPTGRNRRKSAVRPLVLDVPRAYFND